MINRDDGMFLFGSNTLSECIELAQRHAKVNVMQQASKIAEPA